MTRIRTLVLSTLLLVGAGAMILRLGHPQQVRAAAGCNAADTRGTYAVQVSGWVQPPGQTFYLPFAEGGTLIVHSDATFQGVSQLNIGGQFFPTHHFTGRATVNQDCTAVAQILTSDVVDPKTARGFWVIVKPHQIIQQTGLVPGGTTTGQAVAIQGE